MNRHRYAPHPSNSSGEKAQLVLAYQELGKELHSTQLKVIGNYTLGRVIGEGSFGTVRLGIHRLTGSRVAIKHIPKSSSPPLLTREIHHHRRLHHPNVVQLYEVIATEHSIWLITELCPGGELFDYLVEKTRFTEFEARRLFGQICLGLGYVHRQGVVHRDLKLENVLLDERCNPKLADFGFGREFEPRKLLDTFCGTTGYAAPEMLAGRKYLGEEVDIWSLGIILHALLTGSLPFDDDDEDVMKSMIMVGKFDIPSFLSIEASDLIKSILKQDPKARLSIEKILSHPWFILPPSQHTFVESDPLPRPSPIAEESHHLAESPDRSSFSLPSLDHLDQAISLETPKLGNPASTSSPGTWGADPDTSESSCKDSDLDACSGRSNTSSPVTSEDPPAQLSRMPDLGPSSSTRSIGSTRPLPLLPKASPETRPSQRQKASITAIKNMLLPSIEPSQPLCAPALDEPTTSTSIVGVEPTHSEDLADLRENAPSGSSNPSLPVAKSSYPKPRPLSILPALPSSISHPAIRTPSRTKRRSIGSTMSERLGPLDDLSSHTDLATPTTNQGRLSVSSLSTIVIDYLGALKSTTQTPLLSEEDLGLLKSLGAVGFDTGQVIHSVQSNACDSSGAMWWLLKRKLDKQHQDRENLERNANRQSATASLKQQPSTEFQASESAALSNFVSGADVAIDISVDPPSAPHPTMSITSPPDTPMELTFGTSQSLTVDSKQSSTPRKPKPSGSQKYDPLLTPVQIEHEAGAVNFCLHQRSPSNPSGYSGKKPQPLGAISGNINDDARSSTSSAKGDTHSSSDKEGVPWSMDAATSGKKVTPERRKRSQSVSMLQRATHALAPKKSTEDKQTKIRSREGSSATEGEEKHAHEKVSRKDMKAREKEGKMVDETTKSGSLQLSGLFSRKALVLPPIPHLPVGLMLHQSSTAHDKPDKSHGKGKELEVPKDSRASVSMPSSPSKSNEAALTPRRDSDPTHTGQGEEPSPSVTPSVPSSVSFSTVLPQGPLFAQMNQLSTPKPLSTSGTMSTSTPNSKFDDRQSMSDASPALSSYSRIDVSVGTRASESDSLTAKSGRAKGNLFSNFRFWFNEDRRKRKRNTAVMTSYSNLTYSPFSRGNVRNSSFPAGAGSPVGVSSTGGSLPGRKGHGESQGAWPVAAAVGIHRQTSKSSRRSSLQSTRRLSVELHGIPKAANAAKRRSGSSRASFGSRTGSRTPTSEPGSHRSSSQHAANPSRRLSLEGRAKRPPGHLRQASTSSGGSRRSGAPMHHLAPTAPQVVHPGYMRRTSSTGTTVRRITTTTNVGPGGGRHRQAKAPSATSSVRTSMSSDEGSASMPRGPSSAGEEHRLHSPINVYDVEETIEEEEDGEVEEGPLNDDGTKVGKAHGDTNAARRSALQKLSGDEPERSQRRTNGSEGESHSSTVGTRTIFMAHKAHSVFGTPTQAFFERAQTSSPMASKTSGGGGAAYVNLMKTIADGPGTRRGSGEPRLRDVFASKVSEDGEWFDLDDEDDVGQRYEGGIGQGMRRRSEGVGMNRDGGVEVKRQIEKAGRSEAGEEAKTKGSVGGAGQISSGSINGSPGQGTALNLIGNWRGGNHRVMSSFKSAAIEEEEEEEEE